MLRKLKAKGYQKFFGSREPSLEPIVKTLKTNCKEEELLGESQGDVATSLV